MKTYTISRKENGDVEAKVSVSAGGVRGTANLVHVKHHSNTGFEYGFAGSGPADLALSILADHLGERPTKREIYHGICSCWRYHQKFKFQFIAPADGKRPLVITGDEIDEFILGQEGYKSRNEDAHSITSPLMTAAAVLVTIDAAKKLTEDHGLF